MERRGALIVFEGLDRAGKSTQCELLCNNLAQEGHKIRQMRFPGKNLAVQMIPMKISNRILERTSPIGKSIDAYLKGEAQVEDHVIHLLFSANRWEAAAKIRSDIADGFTVVIDRYSYSGAVYSAAKNNPQLSTQWAWQMETGLPRPDICVFLDIEPEVAEERGGFGSERYEIAEMQRRVRELFHELFKMPCASDAVVINAGRSVDLVQQDVLNAVRQAISEVKLLQPLSSLDSMPVS